MVRRRAGLLETDDEPTTRARIAETVAEHVADDGPSDAGSSPPCSRSLGIDATAIGSDQLFGAWRTFFERLAATAPVVMVFEDFHYADSGLVDFVDHLLEWSPSAADLCRHPRPPGAPRATARLGRGEAQLHLDCTSSRSLAEAMRELLAGLVPGLPDSAARAIVAGPTASRCMPSRRSGCSLAEGKLALDGDVYRPTGDLADLAVPETLTALIASRLDALPPDDRTLVSDAAVLGQSFTLAGLAAVSGRPEEDLGPHLRSLVRRELMTLETDPRSPERGQYAFVQALIREVAYNTLAKRDRKARHLAAARFFESLDTDEIAGGLAGHYLAAYRNSPEGAEADAVARRRGSPCGRPPNGRPRSGRSTRPSRFLEQALTVAADSADRADLLERAGEAAAAAGLHDEAERLLRAAIEQSRDPRRPSRRGAGDRGPGSRAPQRATGRSRPRPARTGQRRVRRSRARSRRGMPSAASSPAPTSSTPRTGVPSRSPIASSRRPSAGDMVEILADLLVTKGSALDGIGPHRSKAMPSCGPPRRSPRRTASPKRICARSAIGSAIAPSRSPDGRSNSDDAGSSSPAGRDDGVSSPSSRRRARSPP